MRVGSDQWEKIPMCMIEHLLVGMRIIVVHAPVGDTSLTLLKCVILASAVATKKKTSEISHSLMEFNDFSMKPAAIHSQSA